MNSIAVVIVDTSANAISEYAKSIADRITKSTISVLSNNGCDVFVTTNKDPQLEKVSTYSKIIVLNWGTEIYQVPRFIDQCKQLNKQIIEHDNPAIASFINYIVATDDRFYSTMDPMYFRFTIGMSNTFFMFNSDRFDAAQLPKPINQLVTVAAGLIWLELLIKGGYEKGTTVRFTDCSFFALETVKHIVDNWDGTNYPEFIKNYAESRMSFINVPWQVPIIHEDNMESDWKDLNAEYNFVNVWADIKDKVKFEYRWVNYLEQELNFHDIIDQTNNSVLWLSNLFTGSTNNILYEEGHIQLAYDRLVNITNAEFPHLTVMFPNSMKY